MGSNVLPHQASPVTDKSVTEIAEIVQAQRQVFDMSLDEAIEGLQGAQQALNALKEAWMFSSTPEIRLKIQRASHHCMRLMTDIMQSVHPLSQELQTLMSLETLSLPLKGQASHGKERNKESE
jgi:hypothetical protein